MSKKSKRHAKKASTFQENILNNLPERKSASERNGRKPDYCVIVKLEEDVYAVIFVVLFSSFDFFGVCVIAYLHYLKVDIPDILIQVTAFIGCWLFWILIYTIKKRLKKRA